jgi:hypothetical protein
VQAKWFARELPQTNTVAGTEVILRRLSRDGTGMIHTRGTNREPTGWTSWRTTAFDSWGNWVTGDGTYSLRLSTLLPASEPIWKVRVEGTEYASAAFVQMPKPGEHLILPAKPRLQSQGIQFLMWTGPGHYSISDRFEIQSYGTAFSLSNSLSALVNGSWKLTCAEPGVLCISDGLSHPSVRLRERLELGGRIFTNAHAKAVSHHADSKNRISQFFSPRLPAVSTNLEVEVILRLPPAEFFVNPPR